MRVLSTIQKERSSMAFMLLTKKETAVQITDTVFQPLVNLP